MEMMTTVTLPWDFLLIMTAVMNQVRHVKAFTFFGMCVWVCRESEFVKKCNSRTLKTVESRPNKLWMTAVYN